jgi:signal transduction histidine kinase
MEETRRGLGIIVDAAATLLDVKSMQRLAEGVLTQIGSLLRTDCGGILLLRDAPDDKGFRILAGSGVYERFNTGATGELDAPLASLVQDAFASHAHRFNTAQTALYVPTASGRELVVALDSSRPLTEMDRSLVELFCGKLPFAFDNVLLYEEIRAANETLEQRVIARTRELSAANERLAMQREALRRANTFKNVMLGMVAHELKNPLGVILGRAEIVHELLDMGTHDCEKVRLQVVRMEEPAKSMIRMVDQLLADAMNDAEDIELRLAHVDLVGLTREVMALHQPAADAKGQTLFVEAPERLEAVADPDRLREAIENLISNAVKYSPLGGEITVRLRAEREIEIAVADKGPGLSPEDFGRLFGRFQRLSAKPTGGEASTGLGLSITKHIVALHGGRLDARSAGQGKGTTFTIYLPATIAEGAR